MAAGMMGRSPDEFGDPSDTARRIFRALAERRWLDAARYVDRTAAEEFKHAVVRSAVADEAIRATRVREAGEAGIDATALSLPQYRQRFAVSTVEELESLDPIDMIARMAAAENPGLSASELGSGRSVERVVVGHVFETEETAHVVYRRILRFDGNETMAMEALTLRRVAEGWRSIGLRHLPSYLPWPRG